jgi:hypothetical protein
MPGPASGRGAPPAAVSRNPATEEQQEPRERPNVFVIARSFRYPIGEQRACEVTVVTAAHQRQVGPSHEHTFQLHEQKLRLLKVDGYAWVVTKPESACQKRLRSAVAVRLQRDQLRERTAFVHLHSDAPVLG